MRSKNKNTFSSFDREQGKKTKRIIGFFSIIFLIGAIVGGYFLVREIQLYSHKRLIKGCQGKEFCEGRTGALTKLVRAGKSLKDYNLEKANIRHANLHGADLRNANLEDAYIEDVRFFGAYLTRAKIRDAIIGNDQPGRFSKDFRHPNFEGANFKNASLKDVIVYDASFKNANFEGVSFKNVQFFGSNLEGANLKGVNLQYPNFSSSSAVNLNGANLEGAILSGNGEAIGSFHGANFKNVEVRSGTLVGSLVKSACYWDTGIYRGNWDSQKNKWVADREANQEYIEKLKQSKASDPKNPVDCSMWE